MLGVVWGPCGDRADVVDVVLRVGAGEVAQRLKLGVHVKRVKIFWRRGDVAVVA